MKPTLRLGRVHIGCSTLFESCSVFIKVLEMPSILNCQALKGGLQTKVFDGVMVFFMFIHSIFVPEF